MPMSVFATQIIDIFFLINKKKYFVCTMLDPTNVQRTLNEIQHETSSSLAKKVKEHAYAENILTVFSQRIQAPDLSKTDISLLEKALFILPPEELNSEQAKALITFLEEKGEFNIQNVLDRALLSSASAGNIKMCTMLLDKGAAIDCVDTDGKTPLLNASKSGSLDLVQMLLTREADLKAVDKEGVNALHYACESGNLELVRLLLDQGFTINDIADNGMTPFHKACNGGSRDVAQFLLDQGVNHLETDNDGATAMQWACQGGHMHMIHFLLDKGLDLSAVNNKGDTCLHYANGGGSLKVVQYLQGQGLDLFAVNEEGETCLHYACDQGNLEIVQYLHREGLDPLARNENGNTPFDYACDGGNLEVVQFFLDQGVDPKTKDNEGRTFLHWASRSGNLELVKLLEHNGLDRNAVDNEGKTCLHYASKGDSLEVVQYLHKEGLDLFAVDNHGDTCLHYASKGDSLEVVQYLHKEGLDPLARNETGNTPFDYACGWGNSEVVHFYLDQNVDPKTEDNNGDTSLHWACSSGKLELVKLLVRNGLDPLARNKTGNTPFDYACDTGNLEVVQFFLDQGVDPKTEDNIGVTSLHWACKSGNLELVELLVHNGLDRNAIDNGGKTCSHYACEGGNLEIIQYFQEQGLDLFAVDENGDTCLHYASGGASLEVVEYLHGEGLDPLARNETGNTPFDYACDTGNLEVVQFFLDQGVDPKTEDDNEVTSLHWACKSGNLELVELLERNGLDLNAIDNDGKTCLHYASEGESLEVVQYLHEQGVDVLAKTHSGETALHYACQGENLKVAIYLLERGLSMFEADMDGITPWQKTLSHDFQTEIVKHLSEVDQELFKMFEAIDNANQNPDAKEDNAQAFQGIFSQWLKPESEEIIEKACKIPLLIPYLFTYGNLELAKLLISSGLDPLARNETGITPFDYACGWGNLEVVQFFLDQGVDPKTEDNIGVTSLHWACKSGNLELVELLERNGLDLNAIDNEGKTCLLYACQGYSVEIVQYLQEQGADVLEKTHSGVTALHEACQGENLEVAIYLLKNGLSMFEADMDGITPWQNIKSQDFQIKIVGHLNEVDQELFKMFEAIDYANQNPDAEEVNKQAIQGIFSQWLKPGGEEILEKAFKIPLLIPHLFIYGGDFEKVKWHIEHGADIKRETGKTVLHYACECSVSTSMDPIKFELITYLINQGAYVFVRDNEGFLPFDYLDEESLNKLPQNYREVYQYIKQTEKNYEIDLVENCPQFHITNNEPIKELWESYYAKAIEHLLFEGCAHLLEPIPSDLKELQWGLSPALKAWIRKALGLDIPIYFESEEKEIECKKRLEKFCAELIEEGVKAHIPREFLENWKSTVIMKTRTAYQQMNYMLWMSCFIIQCGLSPSLLSIFQDSSTMTSVMRISNIANSDMQAAATQALFEVYKDDEKMNEWQSLAKTQPPHLLLTSLFLIRGGIPNDTIKKLLESLSAKKYQNTEKMQPINELINNLTKESDLSITDQSNLLEIVFINPEKGKTESQKIYQKRMEKHREDQSFLIAYILGIIAFDASKQLEGISDAETIKNRWNIEMGKFFELTDPAMINKMNALFGASGRFPAALFLYFGKLLSLDQDKETRNSIKLLKQFTQDVIDGSFPKMRYSFKNNPHLETISKDNSSLLDQWRTPVKVPLGEGFTLEDSDQWEDLLLSGTEVHESCQHIMKDANLSICLISYLIDGKNRLILIRNKQGKIVHRTFLRILWDRKKKTPVLFMERSYSNGTHPELAKKIEEGCIAKARAMNLPLLAITKDYPHLKSRPKYTGSIESLGNEVPFEYVDAGGGMIDKGKFSLTSSHIVYDPDAKS